MIWITIVLFTRIATYSAVISQLAKHHNQMASPKVAIVGHLCALNIVPSNFGGVLVPKSLALAENWLYCQEKASFVLILTKSVEPIFQSAGPVL